MRTSERISSILRLEVVSNSEVSSDFEEELETSVSLEAPAFSEEELEVSVSAEASAFSEEEVAEEDSLSDEEDVDPE